MKIISLNGAPKLHLTKTAAAIGIFDGVHRGHQYLIKKMLAAARRLKATPVVITFFPHPAHVLRPDVKLGYLTSMEDRLRRLNDLGVAKCLVIAFNKSFAKIQPEKFIKDALVKKLKVKAVFVGEDFRFGKDRSGDIALFKRLAPEGHYEMHAVPALKQGGKVISSTLIRGLIGEGKLNEAARLLGRKVAVSGQVCTGSKRGKGLGFPTANVDYKADVLPPRGVYVVRAVLGKRKYSGVANIGTRPSFDNTPQQRLEVHIFDFDKNIYGQHLEVEFLKKIRDEKKFFNPQELIQQIRKDANFARKYFKAAR